MLCDAIATGLSPGFGDHNHLFLRFICVTCLPPSTSHSVTCRRQQLLAHFGERREADNCANCDNCTQKRLTLDFTNDAKWLIRAVHETKSGASEKVIGQNF